MHHTPVIPPWTFQDRLRKARESANLTQEELAEALGIIRGSIQRWESGTRYPRPKMIEDLAKATNVPLEWLLHGDEGEEKEESLVEHKEVSITWTPDGLQITKVEKE